MILSKKFAAYTILAVALLGSLILGFGNPAYALLPVADPKTVTTDEDTTVTITLSATDLGVHPLTFAIATSPLSGSVSGVNVDVTCSGTTCSDTVTYTPNANFAGADSFTYTASDGTLTSVPAAVSITVNAVNDVPVANAQSVSTNEDTAVTITLTGTDVDLVGSLTFSIVANPTSGTLGAVTSAGATSATVTYTPNANFNGADSFTFKVTDNLSLDSLTATVSITVNAVNDAPVLATIGPQTVNEGNLLTFTATATDVDTGQTLTFSLSGNAAAGAGLAAITSGGVFTWTPGESKGPGSFTFDVVVTDNGSSLLSDSETITITVNEVNVAPVANAGLDQSANEGSTVTLAGTGTDVDIPTQTLTFAWTQTAGPAVTLSNANTANPTFTAPQVSAQTVLTFQLTVTDASGASSTDTVNITVNDLPSTNNPPNLLNPGTKIVKELETLSFSLSATDPDAGQTLTFSITSGLQSGMSLDSTTGVFSWTPTAAQGPGTYFVTFAATDNGSPILSDSETITITVSDVIPVSAALTQTTSGLSGTANLGDISAAKVINLSLTNNVLPYAYLTSVNFAPSYASTKAKLGVTVANQVLGAPAPPDPEVALYMEFTPSGSNPLSQSSDYTHLPIIKFRIDKVNGACPATQLYLFDVNLNQWVKLANPTLDYETDQYCLMQGQLPHFSKFVVTGGGGVGSVGAGGGGGGVATTGTGGGGPQYVIIDTVPPSIATNHHKPDHPVEEEDLKLTIKATDDVGVKDVKIVYTVNAEPKSKHKVVSTEKISPQWWRGTIPSSDMKTGVISYQIVVTDFSGNTATSELKELKVEEAKAKPIQQEKVTPLTRKATKVDLPSNFIEVTTIDGKKSITTYSDTIVIKNNSSSTLKNVRITPSPEIAKSFYLDKYAIKSIEPYGNATVSLKLHGKPNVDAYGKVTAYDGNIMVTASNHSPVMLPVKINSLEDTHYQEYIDKVTSMAQQRYKISLINTILKDVLIESDIDVTTRTGLREINTPSDEIIIKNLSDRTLNNVRIKISNAGNAFLLDKYNIPQIEPNGEVSVRMIPKIDTSKYTPRDYRGEVIIGSDNAIPKAIPIYIQATPRNDSIDEFEVRIIGNEMTTAIDRISIKNTGNRTMDSVKIMLSDNLVGIFSLSQNSFQRIEAGEEVTVEVKYNAKDLNTFMQNFEGEIKIASEHHNMRVIPVKIQWNKVESDNFVIYARNGDLPMANNVLKNLENHYQNVTSTLGGVGGVDDKAVIYMTGSMEEMQLLNYYGYSFYSYSDDTIFICACDNPRDSVLQEFIYRAVIVNFSTYYNMKKIEMDDGNWLVDGIAKYIVVRNNETATLKYIEAFREEPVRFQWYGSTTDAQYGSTITFFRYLEEQYGENAIYRSLYHLGSGMVSNHRCDTVENCAVLSGVYDAIGLDINKKRYDLDFNSIIEAWASYIAERYGIYY